MEDHVKVAAAAAAAAAALERTTYRLSRRHFGQLHLGPLALAAAGAVVLQPSFPRSAPASFSYDAFWRGWEFAAPRPPGAVHTPLVVAVLVGVVGVVGVVFVLGRLAPKLAFDLVDINKDGVAHAFALFGIPSKLQPRPLGKVDAFGAIVSHVVAGMVTEGKRDDELALVVNQSIDLDAVLEEKGGRYEESFMPQKLRAFLCFVWPYTLVWVRIGEQQWREGKE